MTSDLAARVAALSPQQREALDRVLAEKGRRAPEAAISRRPDQLDRLPLSYEQERLWFMDHLVPNREIFHVPTILRLHGDVDTDALQRALCRLAERHEVLRTTFEERGDGAVQVVHERMDPPLTVEDPDDAEAAATAFIVAPFDLRSGPLVRAGLFRVAAGEHLFVLVQHHIVSDYWSLGVLLGDLGALYAVETGAAQDAPPPPELHYADFAYWQRQTLVGDRLQADLDFWRRSLEGAPELLDLPTDRRRAPIRTTRGRFHHVSFDPELVEQARDLARTEQTTLHVVFLTAYIATLSRHVQQDDVVVGVPVAGRSRPELQDMIGYFLNWLPIRVHVGDRPTFGELLRRTRDASAAGFAHQDLPFEMLVQELQPPRALGTTPVFQTSFSLRDAAPVPPAFPGVRAELATLDGGATHYDLMAELWVEDGEVRGYLPYNDELFEDATIGRIAARMTRLLRGGLAAPDTAVTELSIMDDDELAAALADKPVSDGPVSGTLHGRFAEVAREHPDAVAVTCDDVRLTYAELDERATRLAAVLRGHGAGPGTGVGVCLERSVDVVVAILGVLKTGGFYLPLDPENPPARTERQLADTGSVAVVTTEDLRFRLPDVPAVCLDALPEAGTDAPDADVDPGAVAYVIYTSGSTGTPKGVAVTHANVLRLFRTSAEHFSFGTEDVWTLFHSYAFDFSVWEIWGALLHGGRLIVVPHWLTRAPDAFAQLVVDEGVTVLSQTPSAFAQLTRTMLPGRPEHALRYVVFGGEALDLGTLVPWFEVYGDRTEMVNMYGITETTVHVTYRRIRPDDVVDADASLIGSALPDLGLYLLDEQLRPVPTGVHGELFVGGAGVAMGYVGAPRITAERMLPDPFSGVPGARMYRTGDVARRLPSGELAYLGRNDHQVKIRGHRIELGEIQAALGQVDGVEESIVLARDDGTGQRLVGYVVAAGGTELTSSELRRALLRTLPEWMVPSAFVVLDALPLTRNGKVDRAALPAPEAKRATEDREYVAPRTDAERTLAEIWTELLRIDRVGVGDNFFELGGHSLMVVQLVSRIRERLGNELSIAQLFQHPTLEAMAGILDSPGAVEQAPEAAQPDAVVADLSEEEIDAMLAALDGEESTHG
uniref:Long-chain-fatty-acid--CoA ligase n=1 Tax=uncultured bacterium esnapd17 TaxID=1366598 RepID=S5UD42_9BACT|nr:long-chain-fatty-acid--CoA ligase [uncultured bacterium esnapd17]